MYKITWYMTEHHKLVNIECSLIVEADELQLYIKSLFKIYPEADVHIEFIK